MNDKEAMVNIQQEFHSTDKLIEIHTNVLKKLRHQNN